jgi:hypothetical protein
MGYGLTDVVSEDYRITDPRINVDSILLDRSEGTSVPQPYVEWLAERYPAFDPESNKPNLDNLDAVMERQLLEKSGAEDALRVVTWEGEYGLPNVLVVRPAGETDWHRYNNPIDCQEEAIRGKFMDYRVERTVGNIYPYEGIYMDARTGEQIVGKQADLVRAWRRLINAPLKEGVSEAERAIALDKVASRLGFDVKDHAEAEQCIVPLVPDVIRRVCEWGELFTSPDVWRQLRPVLYTYHS